MRRRRTAAAPEAARERAGGGACRRPRHGGRLHLRSTAFPAPDVGAAANLRDRSDRGRGNPRATRFRAGSKVLVATQSAMFDGHSVRAPRAFRLDRPFDSYLHFGHGLHMCFGREINRVHLPAMAIALLEGPPLRRAPGGAGRMTYHGAYPASLTVSLDEGSK